MEKKYKTFRQRLAILRDRGMDIPTNSNKQRRILKEYNYYNLINAYKNPFLEDKNNYPGHANRNEDYYKRGTKPEHLEAVYLFDVALRSLFFPYLLKIEENLKIVLVESFYNVHSHIDLHKESEYFKRQYYNLVKFSSWSVQEKSGYKYISLSPVRYDRNVMLDHPYELKFDNTKIYDEYIVMVYRAMGQQRSKNQSISKYLNEHTYIPMWVLMNLLTFGNVNKLFQIQTIDVQKNILNYYGINNSNSNPFLDVLNFTNVLNILSLYRNICAHNERLYCFQVRMNISDDFMGYLNIFPQSQAVLNARNNRQNLQHSKREKIKRSRKGILNLIFGLKLLLPKSDFNKIKNELKKELDKLSSKISLDAYETVLKEMGIDKNWQAHL
jgi:hypothetical protein